MKKIGLYIHIPFRIYKINHRHVVCYYNKDFYIKDYFNFLKKELIMRKDDNFLIDSIYIGGGDPSSMDSDYIVDVLETVKENYNIDEDCEITIEINPILPDYRIKNYIRNGINRFSIKAFTFSKKGLSDLGIYHDKYDIRNMIKLLRLNGADNINIDMYFMYPGQSMRDLKGDLKEVLRLNFPHISYYAYGSDDDLVSELIESNNAIDYENLQSDMLELISSTLIKAGYDHYEINHFEKNNSRSHHNLKYWNLDEYLAVGLGSSGFINKELYRNITDLEEYFKKIKNGELPYLEKERLSEEEIEKNYIISRMGLKEGIDINEINKRFNIDFLNKYKNQIEKNKEILEIKNNKIRFTENGMYYSNEFYLDII